MSPARVSLAESAFRDVEDIRAWYARQGAEDAGDKLIRELRDCMAQLSAFPAGGRIVPEFAQPWLRELIRLPFRIVYRVDTERVRIVQVWRSERLLETWP